MINMHLKEKSAEWEKINADKSIDLGDYKVIKEPEDWVKGTRKAVRTVLERIEASDEVKRKADELLEKVNENQVEFSGNSRLSIASAIVYFASRKEIGTRRLAEEGSISTASLKNMIQLMGNAIDLN